MADEQRLLVRLEASTAKLEKQLARANSKFASSARVMEKSFERPNKRVQQGLKANASAFAAFGRITGQQRFIIQNSAAQLGDMAVQLETGAGAARVFGQQIPQLLGPMGTLGAILGTVAAIGIPVAAALFSMGDAADDAGDKIKDFADASKAAESAISDATSAVRLAVDTDVDAIVKKYGEATSEVYSLIEALARLKVTSAAESTQTALTKFFDENSQLEDFFKAIEDRNAAILDLQREAGVLSDQIAGGTDTFGDAARQLDDVREALAGFETMQDVSEAFDIAPGQIDRILEMRDALQEALAAGNLQGALDAVVSLRQEFDGITTGPLRDLGDGLAPLEDLIRRTVGPMASLEAATGAAANQAGRLAENFAQAARNALSIPNAGDEKAVKIDETANNTGTILDALVTNTSQTRRTAGGRSGGSAGGSSATARKTPFYIADRQSAESALELAKLEVEALSMTSAAAAELRAKVELLSKAKRAGLDLDERSAETGRTLKDEIDLQAEAIGRLTQAAKVYKDQAEGVEFVQGNLKEAFLDAADGSKSFGDALDSLIDNLRRAALEATFFGTGSLSGLFGTSGRGGGLLGGLFGTLFPARAGGGAVRSGSPYLVNEDTPNSEIFVPSTSGAVLNVRQAQQALRGSAAGAAAGKVDVRVFVDQDGQWHAAVERIASAQALPVAAQVVTENNRRLQQAQRRA